MPQYVRPVTSETQILIIKNADATGNVLLLQSTDRPLFAIYDPAKGAIAGSNSSTWSASKEKELDCWEQSTPDEYSGPSYGYYILAARKSPDNSKIAVLSAYGPKLPGVSLHPGLGGSERIWGTRYLELRDVPDYSSIARPTRIDISGRVAKPRICWSDGGKYVLVYSDDKDVGDKVSIVDVP